MVNIYRVLLTDAPLGCPFAPKKKPWISAAIAAVAAVAGTIANSANTNKVNNTNSDIAKQNLDLQREVNDKNIALQRETNAQNYKMMQEQNAFNLDMWNKENDYNSPTKQVQRLLAAGINPSSQFGSSTGSLASSLTSAQANPAGSPKLDAPRNYFEARQADFSGISDAGIQAVNAYNSSRLMQAETKNKEALTGNTVLDNTYKMRSMSDQLRYLHNMANGNGWQAEIAKKQLEFIAATQQYDIDMKYGDYRMQQKSLEMLDKQIAYQDLQNQILEITKGYAHQMNQAQISQLWSSVHQANAQIGLINANRLLTEEQRLHEVEKKVGTIIDNGMKSCDLDVKKAVKGVLIQAEKDKGDILNFENRNKVSGERFRRFQSIIPFTAGYEKPKFF